IFHGSVSVTLVGSLCFCAKAVGRGSLVTSKHERMAGRCYQHPPAAHFHSRKPPLLAASEFIPVPAVILRQTRQN
ncbi:hypothetical protein OSL68_31930, partial [Escherichia coli]|nr:hypothetical protein [Escherichia coli]